MVPNRSFSLRAGRAGDVFMRGNSSAEDLTPVVVRCWGRGQTLPVSRSDARRGRQPEQDLASCCHGAVDSDEALQRRSQHVKRGAGPDPAHLCLSQWCLARRRPDLPPLLAPGLGPGMKCEGLRGSHGVQAAGRPLDEALPSSAISYLLFCAGVQNVGR